MTGRKLLHELRRLGITLARNGDKLKVDYPDGRLWTPELRQAAAACKSELLAIVDGDYTRAALELVLRESIPGEWRDELVHTFDERLGICIENRSHFGAASRMAYVAVAKQIEQAAAPERRLA